MHMKSEGDCTVRFAPTMTVAGPMVKGTQVQAVEGEEQEEEGEELPFSLSRTSHSSISRALTVGSRGTWKSIVRTCRNLSRSTCANRRSAGMKLGRTVAPGAAKGDSSARGQNSPLSGKVLAVSVSEEVADSMARVEGYFENYPPITMIVDNGADYHIVGNRDLLLDMEGCSKKLITAKGEDLGVIGVGTLSMCLGNCVN